jgi:hypothetical protein
MADEVRNGLAGDNDLAGDVERRGGISLLTMPRLSRKHDFPPVAGFGKLNCSSLVALYPQNQDKPSRSLLA